MNCVHKRIKSVNCVLYCMECGAELPPDFLTKPKQEAAEEPKTDKSAPKKRTAKNRV